MSRKIDWPKYNQNLVKKGDFTLIMSQEVIKNWQKQGKMGRPGYSDLLILAILTLRPYFNLTFRQTEGFVSAIIRSASLPFICPDYTILCKRMKALKGKLPKLSTRPLKLFLLTQAESKFWDLVNGLSKSIEKKAELSG